MTAAASAPAAAPPTFDELDAILDEIGGDLVVLQWSQDRPILPREASAILHRHEADPTSTRAGRSRETVLAAERQLRLQASTFSRCRAALLAGDASMVPASNAMGSGYDEIRELLVDAAELRVLLRDPAAIGALAGEHEALAELFGAAGERCLKGALRLQAERHRIHGADIRAVLTGGLEQNLAEAGRRRRSSGTGARA